MKKLILLNEIQRSLVLWRYWLYRAWLRFSIRYRGTRLGLSWPVFSNIFVALVLSIIWSTILDQLSLLDYFLYLFSGFPVWLYISSTVNVGTNGVGNSAKTSLPFTNFIFEGISLNSMPLLMVVPFVIAFSLILNQENSLHILLLPVAILCLYFWSIGTIALLTVITTIKPDLKHFVKLVMRLAFLATPIIWQPDRLGEYASYLLLNPFYLPLELFRYCLSGINHQTNLIWLTLGYSLTTFLFGLVILQISMNRLKILAFSK